MARIWGWAGVAAPQLCHAGRPFASILDSLFSTTPQPLRTRPAHSARLDRALVQNGRRSGGRSDACCVTCVHARQTHYPGWTYNTHRITGVVCHGAYAAFMNTVHAGKSCVTSSRVPVHDGGEDAVGGEDASMCGTPNTGSLRRRRTSSA